MGVASRHRSAALAVRRCEGPRVPDANEVSEEDLSLLDRITGLTQADNSAFAELRSTYEEDARLRVPPVINRYTRAGVRKVHLRVSGPPHRFPCHYGIDFSTKGELIAATKSVEELQHHLGLDSLAYLTLEGLLASTGIPDPEHTFCKACFDGCYPVAFDENGVSKDCLETF